MFETFMYALVGFLVLQFVLIRGVLAAIQMAKGTPSRPLMQYLKAIVSYSQLV